MEKKNLKYVFDCCLFVCSLALVVSCASQGKKDNENSPIVSEMNKNDVTVKIDLTVAEGKRLIAKGIVNTPCVREKLRSGMIIITRGSTNTYVAEELAGLDAEHGAFLTGHFVPAGMPPFSKGKKPNSEIVLIDGKIRDIPYEDAVKMLKEGDIIFKGANLLNYERGQAAVCIGAPDGGTVYKFLPYVGKGKGRLIVPVGLEKQVFGNLEEYVLAASAENEKLNWSPKLHLFAEGEIFTEIEALRSVADVKVYPVGAGGICGREGGISLLVAGNRTETEKVIAFVKSVQGEKPFDE